MAEKYELIIHVSKREKSSAIVGPYDVSLLFLPQGAPVEEQRAFACFSFECLGLNRTGFMIEIPVSPGANHFDILVGGDDLIITNDVGLQSRKDGQIYKIKAFAEPHGWHNKVTVVQGTSTTVIYDARDRENENPLVEWWRGSNLTKIRGNVGMTMANNLKGREAIEAMVEALQLILSRMPEKEEG